VKKSSYREPDYAFGQLMLSLRTAIGLTQAGLADLLGVSRNGVGGWEVGQSYPKAFIVLALRASVFATGREENAVGWCACWAWAASASQHSRSP
jgi:DNA-binding XRE family transcriptional regulator